MALLRHVGMKVKNLEMSMWTYQALGFKQQGEVETFKVAKMVDEKGQVFELYEGNYTPHISVNWYEDLGGNLIEIVKEKT